MVWVNGNEWVTKEEYHTNKESYSVASSGKVTCIDLLSGETVSIPVDMYYSNKDRFVTTKKDRKQRYVNGEQTALFRSGEVPPGWTHWRKGTVAPNKGVPSNLVPVINLETNEKELISKEDYAKLKNVKYVHVTAFSKTNPQSGFVRVYFKETGEMGSVTREEYKEHKGTKYIHAPQVKRLKEKGLL
jgi:hypothetical protein